MKMGADTAFELELPRTADASWHARRWLEDRYTTELENDELDTTKLLATELVSNAVRHGHGTITLRAALDQNRLLIEVIDEGSSFERVLDQHDFEKVGGRGLKIVEVAASRWGVHEGTTHVWFELERTGPQIGADSKQALKE